MSAPRTALVANFVADLRRAQVAQLVSEGYDVGELDTKDDTWVGAAWATAILQRLPRCKRTVHLSKELAARHDIRAELRHVERAIRKGHNLNPFLSTRHRQFGIRREPVQTESGEKKTIERPRGIDLLFAAWRIHHMHLGPPSTKRVARTNDLLFARFEGGNAYLINSYPHQSAESESPFSKQELLHIIHRNWPQLLGEPTGIPVPRSGTPVSDEDMGKALRAGLTVPVVIDGKTYLPSRGIMTSTHSSDAVTAAHRALEQAFAAQKWCGEHAEEIAAAIASDSGGSTPPSSIELRYVVNGRKARIVAKPSGKRVRLVDGRVALD